MSSLPPPVVETGAGPVEGRRHGALTFFRGIPYAAAPVGAHRFAPPAPVPRWSGVRPAVEPGANAPQRTRKLPGLDAAPLIGEGWTPGDEYLALDVWCPAGDEREIGR